MQTDIEKIIVEAVGEDRKILNKIDSEDDRYWKRNRNNDIGYNQALSDLRTKAPEIAKKIVELLGNK